MPKVARPSSQVARPGKKMPNIPIKLPKPQTTTVSDKKGK